MSRYIPPWADTQAEADAYLEMMDDERIREQDRQEDTDD